MKKILIASATIGAGHDRAADAIDAACRETYSDRAASKWFNCLTYTGSLQKAMYADGYNFVTNRTPGVWGMFYRLFYRGSDMPIQRLLKKTESKQFRPMVDYIRQEAPDLLICTHFLPANVVLNLKSARPRIPVYVVITDYDCHSFWINLRATGYFAGNNFVKSLLEAEGFPGERVRVTGIPIHPLFSRERDPERIRSEVGLTRGRATILLMGGGFGVDSTKEAFRRLLQVGHDAQFVVVCGKNEKLKRDLEKIAQGDRRALIFGFRRDVHDLMQVSDLIISKAGGATTSESMARGLPMLVFSPTPGQEVRNTVYLMERGAGLLASDPADLKKKAAMLLDQPALLSDMRQKALSIARPNAARDVVRLALEHHEADWKAAASRRSSA
jgi:processive 1,2-diacylglycerol beta-glucosyltransferase